MQTPALPPPKPPQVAEIQTATTGAVTSATKDATDPAADIAPAAVPWTGERIEYRIANFTASEALSELNRLGAEGWRPLLIIPPGGLVMFRQVEAAAVKQSQQNKG